jgi:general secretion pathway protein E
VRRVCKECRQAYVPTPEELREVGLTPDDLKAKGVTHVYRAQGCPNCADNGYRGRTGIYEFLLVDDEIRQLVLKNVDSSTMKKTAVQKGMDTLLTDGAKKVLDGETTIAEVLSVTQEDI